MSDIQRDREERQYVIEVLKSWDGYFIGYTSDEVQEALRYAIASIKTDLKYDLLYEETSGQADKPTTKNNLAVDKEQLKTMIRGLTKWYVKRDNTEVGEPNTAVGLLYDDVMFGIDRLPSVTPQEPRWISVTERLPEENICDDGYHEPSNSVLVQMKSGTMHTARYWSRYDERWLDLNYPTTDEVIAWMPLPKAYREVVEE